MAGNISEPTQMLSTLIGPPEGAGARLKLANKFEILAIFERIMQKIQVYRGPINFWMFQGSNIVLKYFLKYQRPDYL